MTFVPLTTAEATAKHPVDDALMGKIKDNFDDLNSRIAASDSLFVWEVGGQLRRLNFYKRSIAYGLVTREFTPTRCRFMLKRSGLSGTLSFDIRRHTKPLTPITAISAQYSGATSSIGRQGSALNTQSIARSTAQISTQTITYAKAAINVTSIIAVPGTNRWRYNLATAPDTDWVVGKSVTFASCTTGGNNLTATIVEVNQSGYPSVVIDNASGAAQTGTAGTAQLMLMSYNFTNPVSTEFAVGESFKATSHTDAVNDGNFEIYAINQSGNNIRVFNSAGLTQGSAAGTADVLRFKYALSTAASTTDYVVGEAAHLASHTSGVNDGDFTITAVNLGGNNVTVYNAAGTTQGGAVGTVNTNRWKYTLPTDPVAQVTAGDTMYMTGHTSSANDGTFTIKQVNVSSGTNVVVYNLTGATQVGSAGTSMTTRKLVQFSSDQSANYTTNSYIEMRDCASGLYNFANGREPFRVLQVNRGGGANYNVVIDAPTAPEQASPAGLVELEMKSLFNTVPTMAAAVVGNSPNENVVGESTDLIAAAVTAQTPIMLYILGMHVGDPRDLTVSLI